MTFQKVVQEQNKFIYSVDPACKADISYVFYRFGKLNAFSFPEKFSKCHFDCFNNKPFIYNF